MRKKAANLSVKARRNEHPEKTIRRFIKKIKKAKILEEARERRHYTKPSDMKRLKKKRSDARRRKNEAN
tara:strand:+ start:705 stop:911 length:207 start_codon:yes stop_codon:yes gene_type:complete